MFLNVIPKKLFVSKRKFNSSMVLVGSAMNLYCYYQLHNPLCNIYRIQNISNLASVLMVAGVVIL